MHDGLCHLGANASASAPVHPTQLYESLISWALLGLLAFTWKRRRFVWKCLVWSAPARIGGVFAPAPLAADSS